MRPLETPPVRSTNVRRSIVTMLTTLVGLSTPLAGQNALTAGLAYTFGSGFDVTLEATGYVGSNSPLPVGSPWGGVSGLLGLRFGDPKGSRLGLLIGPTVFLGTVTDVRAFLGVRFEAPLARREHHP